MKKRILIVNDHVRDAALTLRAIDQCELSHTVEIAGDGIEARKLLIEHQFDLLIIDVDTPRSDGLELLGGSRLKTSSLR